MNSTVSEEPGYLIHSIPYRESSVIATVFSLNNGIIQVVAKGVRRPKSPLRSTLQLFQPLLLSWTGKSDLKNLIQAETASSHYLSSLPSGGLLYCCGLYMNELLTRLMPKAVPAQELFAAYVQAIAELFESNSVEPVLRRFEAALLHELGEWPDFEFDKNTGASIQGTALYCLTSSKGFDRIESQTASLKSGSVFTGKLLASVADLKFDDPECSKAAKYIHRALIEMLLDGRPLNSRELIKKLMESKHG